MEFKLTESLFPELVLWESFSVQNRIIKNVGPILLGGTRIAVASSKSKSMQATLSFHGGRQQWYCEMENFYGGDLPRNTAFGTLSQMMQRFMDITGIELPAMRIIQLGEGISTYTRRGVVFDSRNPFQLTVGHRYQVRHRNQDRTFLVVQRGANVEIGFTDVPGGGVEIGETFGPGLILNHTAWQSLRHLSGDAANELDPQSLSLHEISSAPAP